MISKSLNTSVSLLFLFPSPALASPDHVIEELVSVNKPLEAEQSFIQRVRLKCVFTDTLDPGAKIPLHTHPSPVVVYLQQEPSPIFGLSTESSL